MGMSEGWDGMGPFPVLLCNPPSQRNKLAQDGTHKSIRHRDLCWGCRLGFYPSVLRPQLP